ncbi:MAG: glycine/sarcosine/betaine reductase selenoprotein B family protein [Thermaerobacter sp.]|nr:glycine/sarcosine/betaine reductase selenoprotein B family protein [Thermaerobacter sp.]
MHVLPPDWAQRYSAFLADPATVAAVAADDDEAFFGSYPRVLNPTTSSSTLPKPLSTCRVGLLSSAGIYGVGQPPFRWQGMFGDTSARALPAEGLDAFSIAQGHYDENAVRDDLNVLVPVRPLQALAKEGFIAELAGPIYSIDGYCTDAAGLVRDAGGEILAGFRAAAVDAALLVPV